MEQLCIASFLHHGHSFHLYVYQDTAGIPAGTVVLDGNTILPADRIFTYREHKTYAGFANFFRYKLLLEKGGWFVDADTICVKPFNFRK
jgi:mannosyltransferase OCH1-like enzyme